MKVIVKRKRWLRGDSSYSALYRSHDKLKCCLGFVCQTAGIPISYMKGEGDPSDINSRQAQKIAPQLLRKVKGGYYIDNATCKKMMAVNDNDSPQMTDARREKLLTTLGKKVGIEFEFVD